MDNATKYELIDKISGNILVVTGMEFGDETVTAIYDGGEIVFTNKGKSGDLQNEQFAIREIGTNSQPDGTGVVDDMGIPTE